MDDIKKIFDDLNPENQVSEIESYCVSCEGNGITRLLLTKIPYFKEVIIMSFECNCGFRNTEVQPGSSFADLGVNYEITIVSARDMNRRVIKSEYANINIPDLDLEIPPQTQKGKVTTIEGFIQTCKENIERSLNDGLYDNIGEESIKKLKDFLAKLQNALEQKLFPFKFHLDDPSGNSYVENPYSPNTDPYGKVTNFVRTKEMLKKMGIYLEEDVKNGDKEESKENYNNNNHVKEESKENYNNNNHVKEESKEVNRKKTKKEEKIVTNGSYTEVEQKKLLEKANKYRSNNNTVYSSKGEISAHLVDFSKSIENNQNLEQETLTFATNCYCCNYPGENKMCICTIPHFKEIIITCFKCDKCGFKTADVRGGGGFSDKAKKISFKIETVEDLNRDLFKSETAKISIPELQFETDSGSMGGLFNTVEGVICKVIDNLENIPFNRGDSLEDNSLDKFIKRMKGLVALKEKFTLVIDDPLSNSFIYSPFYPENDPKMEVIEYERSWEQNEDLGINDMRVENYEYGGGSSNGDAKNIEIQRERGG